MKDKFSFIRHAYLKIRVAFGGGLHIGVVPSGRAVLSPQKKKKPGVFQPNAWILITSDSEITIFVDRSEMGQGVMTALPMLVAEELCIDLERVQIQFATGEPEYANPMFDIQGTMASTSIWGAWDSLRLAGAVAREMLVTAAADLWQEPKNHCKAHQGEIYSIQTGKRASYGDLALLAERVRPQEITLTDPTDFKIIGTSIPRLDGPSKINGTAIFGIDVQLPGMLTAVIARPPRPGAKPRAFRRDSALLLSGVHDICAIDSGIAVVADTFWQAIEARKALSIEWDLSGMPQLDEESIWTGFRRAAKRRHGRTVLSIGDYKAACTSASRILKAEYELPYLAHGTMEPMNCTAHVQNGCCDIWAPTQNPEGTRLVAADLTKLPLSSINVHVTFLGCGFGRRLELDFVSEAVELSKRVNAPVKVIWTREDDMRHDFYRPAALCQVEAALDEQLSLIGWRYRSVSTSIWKRIATQYADLYYLRWMPGKVRQMVVRAAGWVAQLKPDPNIPEGATELPYDIKNILVDYIKHDPGIPTGPLRSVSYSINVFAVESFIDEIAGSCGTNPCNLRRHLLRNNPRFLKLLEMLFHGTDWKQNPSANTYMGMATYSIMGTAVAMVAEVECFPPMNLRVTRIVCAIDCGIIVNPDIVRAQVESGIVFGLGMTLNHAITVYNGSIEQGNFDQYPLIRFDEMPKVEVYIASSHSRPTGIGEAAVPGVAPAVCNAIFSATGIRLRRLPLAMFDTSSHGT